MVPFDASKLFFTPHLSGHASGSGQAEGIRCKLQLLTFHNDPPRMRWLSWWAVLHSRLQTMPQSFIVKLMTIPCLHVRGTSV